MRLFRDFILQGQPHLLPLHLASFRAYASSTSLPICLQGSIPGSWLTITWTEFPPASLCSIARPQRLFIPVIRAFLSFPIARLAYVKFRFVCCPLLGFAGIRFPSTNKIDN